MTTSTNSDRRNSQADVSTLINAAMSGSQAESNRQAKFTAFLFANEVHYSSAQCEALLSLQGTKKTERIADILSDLSEEYARNVAELAALKEKIKAEKQTSAADAFQVETLNGKLRAANMLFTRALTATFYLRQIKARSVSIARNGSIVFWSPAEEDGKPILDDEGKPAFTRQALSGNSLVRAGSKAYTAKHPRSTGNGNGDTARNPSSAQPGITTSAETVRSVISKARMVAKANGKPFSFGDMSDPEEKALDELFRELVITMFADSDGHLDRAALVDWIEDTFGAEPVPAKDKAKQSA